MPVASSRHVPTDLELAVAQALRKLRRKFVREHEIAGYHVDFLVGKDTILEADGLYWHSSEKALAYDAQKDAELRAKGYRVVRLTEAAIKADPMAAVMRALRV